VFLRKYAEYLALDPQKVTADYLALFDRQKKK
jgi:cytoskeletal protein RodZ